MRVTRSGRVSRPCQRLVDAPEVEDDVTDEDESVEMGSTSSDGDDSSLGSFIVDDSSSCTDSGYDSALTEFVNALFDGVSQEKVDETMDMVIEGKIPRAAYAGLLSHLATGLTGDVCTKPT